MGYVAEYILANPDIRNNMSKVIEGWGFDHTSWATGEMPLAVSSSQKFLAPLNINGVLQADFDANPITRGRPIILQGKDGHSIWVSPSTLKANAPYPTQIQGGVIIRDATGNPTGPHFTIPRSLYLKPSFCIRIISGHCHGLDYPTSSVR